MSDIDRLTQEIQARLNNKTNKIDELAQQIQKLKAETANQPLNCVFKKCFLSDNSESGHAKRQEGFLTICKDKNERFQEISEGDEIIFPSFVMKSQDEIDQAIIDLLSHAVTTHYSREFEGYPKRILINPQDRSSIMGRLPGFRNGHEIRKAILLGAKVIENDKVPQYSVFITGKPLGAIATRWNKVAMVVTNPYNVCKIEV